MPSSGDSKERKHKSRDKDKESSSRPKEGSKERSSHKDKERRSEKQGDDRDKERRKRDDDSKESRRHKEQEGGAVSKTRDRNKDEKSSKEDKEKSRKEKDRDREKKKDRDIDDNGDRDKRKDKDRHVDRKDKDRRDKDSDGKERDRKEKDRERREKESERKDKDRVEKESDKKDRDRDRKHRDREDSEKRHKDRKNRDGDKEERKRERSADREKRRKRRDDDELDNNEDGKKREGSSKERKKHRESSGKSRKHKERESSAKNKEEEEAANAQDEYDYEDDFDDYDDDDFEEVDDEEEEEDESEDKEDKNESESSSNVIKPNSAQSQDEMKSEDEIQGMMPQHSFLEMTPKEKAGLEELMQAISKENEKVSTTRSPKTDRKNKQKNEKSNKKEGEKQTHGKINFVAASQKQITDKAAKKTKKRGEELLGLIQLDVRSIDLFDMPPMTEYELYMKRFGSSDSRQMFTQTNDENFDQECQTDDIETETRWCQHTSDSKSAGTSKGTGTSDDITKDIFINSDSVRLNKFLLKASKVCLALLEEIEAGIEQPRKQYVETKSHLSEGYVALGSSEFLVLGRDVCDIRYSPTQTNMLLTAHGTSNVVKKDLKSSKGLLCVWNSNEPNKPTRLLVCESVPNSCCFGGINSTYAFAGMEDGIVGVWDLTEPAFYHETSQIGNSMLVFQNVTFTTAALEKKHSFPVVAVTPLTHYSGSSQTDMSFQLATMDQSASVHIWTLVRTQTDNLSDLKNVGDDLGLAPHGRVKLVNSASLTPPGVSVSSFAHLFSMKCLKVNESNPSDMYAGTDDGEILHMARFTNRPTPKYFKQEDGNNTVNAIDLSPWKMPYLLACYDDGCVRLFHIKTEQPLMVWPSTTNGASLLHVQWSRSRPSVFYTMDSESVLFIWDLLESDVAPVQQMKIQRKDKRAVGFTLANDYSALGRGSPGRVAEMALIFGDGSVEIHRLNKKWSNMAADELDRMESFLANVT